VFLIGGLASLLFGVVAFAKPGIALLVLSMFFAAAILVDGAFSIVGSIQNREKDGWWVMLLIGILGVGVGGYALMNPPISMLAFVYWSPCRQSCSECFSSCSAIGCGWQPRASGSSMSPAPYPSSSASSSSRSRARAA
jgi:hypothetical protein